MKVKIIFFIGLILVISIIFLSSMRLTEQTNLIPKNDLASLERAAEIFKKYNVWYIELSDGGYLTKDKNENRINMTEITMLEAILYKNHIYAVYQDIPDNMIYYKITGSEKIYGFSNTWFQVKIKDLIWWLWKVSKIINNNWIILDECTRTNCPELDR